MASFGQGQPRYNQPQVSPSTTNLLTTSRERDGYGVQVARANAPRAPPSMMNKSSMDDARFISSRVQSVQPSLSDKFSLSADPSSWGADLSPDIPDTDDDLHNPDPRRDRKHDMGGHVFTGRGIANLGCLLILAVGIVTLFAGYPLISYFTKSPQSAFGGFNLGGINASGQVPAIPGNWGPVDLDTPQEVRFKNDYVSGNSWQLVFSDEFNTEGRTFYPGDDPYWEAVDLHYWETNNLEWYDPAAITTKNGSLQITLSRKATHGLNFQSGMMSTWNKFCFTGGMIETAVSLPGINNVVGLWPAVWTMGNLGRAGYGASLEGMWPYTYDECDVGTAPNQTINGLPLAATENGDPTENGVLSFLPGQRLSRCTCPGESHPGPIHKEDGSYVGRSAPEIDVFEAQITGQPLSGQVSQSAQWAPFDAAYTWANTSSTYNITNPASTFLNPYKGGAFQQATSGVTETDQTAYEMTGGNFAVYGFQYKPGFDGAYIGWIANDQLVWSIQQAGLGPNSAVEIGPRPVPQEPMYIIVNLGMSLNFGTVDLDHLTFPTTMKVDYIRVYQDPNAINVGCDPTDFPTAAYIEEYSEAYTNPNLTTWRNDFGQPFPKNKLLEQC